jgi:hypothetical protein
MLTNFTDLLSTTNYIDIEKQINSQKDEYYVFNSDHEYDLLNKYLFLKEIILRKLYDNKILARIKKVFKKYDTKYIPLYKTTQGTNKNFAQNLLGIFILAFQFYEQPTNSSFRLIKYLIEDGNDLTYAFAINLSNNVDFSISAKFNVVLARITHALYGNIKTEDVQLIFENLGIEHGIYVSRLMNNYIVNNFKYVLPIRYNNKYYDFLFFAQNLRIDPNRQTPYEFILNLNNEKINTNEIQFSYKYLDDLYNLLTTQSKFKFAIDYAKTIMKHKNNFHIIDKIIVRGLFSIIAHAPATIISKIARVVFGILAPAFKVSLLYPMLGDNILSIQQIHIAFYDKIAFDDKDDIFIPGNKFIRAYSVLSFLCSSCSSYYLLFYKDYNTSCADTKNDYAIDTLCALNATGFIPFILAFLAYVLAVALKTPQPLYLTNIYTPPKKAIIYSPILHKDHISNIRAKRKATLAICFNKMSSEQNLAEKHKISPKFGAIAPEYKNDLVEKILDFDCHNYADFAKYNNQLS